MGTAGLEALRRLKLDVERGNCEYNVSPYVETIEKELKKYKTLKKIKNVMRGTQMGVRIDDMIEYILTKKDEFTTEDVLNYLRFKDDN